MVRAILGTLAVVVAIAAGVAGAVLYGGVFNVAANEPHTPVVRWAFERTLESSVESAAEDIIAPQMGPDRVTPASTRLYETNCTFCHGAPGRPAARQAQNMRPQPPAFAEQPLPWEAREIFWIVENGIKMTAMPAWGSLLSEEEIWNLAAVLDALPEMSSERYDELTRDETEGATQSADAGSGSGSGTDGGSQTADEKEGDGEASGETASGGDASPKVEMTQALKFAPAEITIAKGETVTWTNVSDVPHTVTADPAKANDASHVRLPDGAETFDSGMIDPGGTFSRTFDVPGRYTYFCIPHEAAGMVGEIVVE